MMDTITLTTNGRVTIPADIRRRFCMRSGTRIFITEKEGRIILKPLTLKSVDKSQS